MIDYHMRQHHRRIYGAKASKEIRETRRAARTTRPTPTRPTSTRLSAAEPLVRSRSSWELRGSSQAGKTPQSSSRMLAKSLHTSLTELNSVASTSTVASRIGSFLSLVEQCEQEKQRATRSIDSPYANKRHTMTTCLPNSKSVPKSVFKTSSKSPVSPVIMGQQSRASVSRDTSKLARVRSKLLNDRNYQTVRRREPDMKKEAEEKEQEKEYADDFEEEEEEEEDVSSPKTDRPSSKSRALDWWLSDQATRTEARKRALQYQRGDRESSLDSACGLSGGESKLLSTTREPTPDTTAVKTYSKSTPRSLVYLNFVNGVSREILAKKVFSDRVVRQAIEKQSVNFVGVLSREELELLVNTLRHELGLGECQPGTKRLSDVLLHVFNGEKERRRRRRHNEFFSDSMDEVADILEDIDLNSDDRCTFHQLMEDQGQKKECRSSKKTTVLRASETAFDLMDVSFNRPMRHSRPSQQQRRMLEQSFANRSRSTQRSTPPRPTMTQRPTATPPSRASTSRAPPRPRTSTLRWGRDSSSSTAGPREAVNVRRERHTTVEESHLGQQSSETPRSDSLYHPETDDD